jgi:hypothetical protein
MNIDYYNPWLLGALLGDSWPRGAMGLGVQGCSLESGWANSLWAGDRAAWGHCTQSTQVLVVMPAQSCLLLCSSWWWWPQPQGTTKATQVGVGQSQTYQQYMPRQPGVPTTLRLVACCAHTPTGAAPAAGPAAAAAGRCTLRVAGAAGEAAAAGARHLGGGTPPGGGGAGASLLAPGDHQALLHACG